MTLYFQFGKFNRGFELRLRWNQYDFNERGRVWEWRLRLGKWVRGEGVRILIEKDSQVELTYWENKDGKQTNWALRTPYRKWES